MVCTSTCDKQNVGYQIQARQVKQNGMEHRHIATETKEKTPSNVRGSNRLEWNLVAEQIIKQAPTSGSFCGLDAQLQTWAVAWNSCEAAQRSVLVVAEASRVGIVRVVLVATAE